MKKILVILYFVLLFAALSVLATVPEIAGIKVDVFVGAIVYFAVIVLLIRKSYGGIKPCTTLWLALLGASLFPIPIHGLNFPATIFSFYEYLISILSIVVGYYYATLNPKGRVPLLILFFVILLVVSSFGVDLWRTYVAHPINPPC